MPATAFAAGTGKAIQLGASNISGYDSTSDSYDYIYMGNYNDKPIKWRVLDADKANDGSTAGMFLLSEYLLASGVQFEAARTEDDGDGQTNPNEWQHSDAQQWCTNFYSNHFSVGEQGAVLGTTKSDEAFTSIALNVRYDASNNILNGDKVFFLSAEEAEYSAYGLANDDARKAYYSDNGSADYWLLRSPIADESSYAGVVSSYGDELGNLVDTARAARPAFNLALDSVLFTSAAEGGKSSGPIGAGALEEVLKYTGSEWKLTLKDGSRDSFSVGETTVNGNALTVDYSGATTGPNEYISAVVMDSSNTVIYYGRIKSLTDPGDARGTVQITLPRGFIRSTDTLYLFSEQYNGDYMTDYASDLVELPIPEDSGVELRSTNTHIQWRHVGEDDNAWRDLVALSAITGGDGADGADGREVELQVANGYIQWRYTTGADTEWRDLMPLSDLKGDSGEDGEDGREVELQNNGTSIQWRYVGETEWKDLVDLSAITGSDGQDGSDGTDGREVELRVEGSYIQWKYDADSDWQNLIAVSALQGIKGDKGDPGEDGDTPTIGANGNWWISGVDTGIPATGSNGADGSDGSDGTDGLTPYIGSNGNWWIGSTDTGIKATGSDGKGGQNGVDGQDGKDGVGIANIEINENGELVVTLTDGTEKKSRQGDGQRRRGDHRCGDQRRRRTDFNPVRWHRTQCRCGTHGGSSGSYGGGQRTELRSTHASLYLHGYIRPFPCRADCPADFPLHETQNPVWEVKATENANIGKVLRYERRGAFLRA